MCFFFFFWYMPSFIFCTWLHVILCPFCFLPHSSDWISLSSVGLLVRFPNNCNSSDITCGVISSSRGIHSRLRPESSNPCGVVLACPEHQGASPAPVVRMKCPLVHRRDAHLSGSEPLEIWSSLAFFYYYFFVCVGLIPLITVQDICQVHVDMTSVIGWGLGLARLEKGCIWSHPFYDRICSGSLFIDGE